MDNIAVNELITFFDLNDGHFISFDNNDDPIFRTEGICMRIVKI